MAYTPLNDRLLEEKYRFKIRVRVILNGFQLDSGSLNSAELPGGAGKLSTSVSSSASGRSVLE